MFKNFVKHFSRKVPLCFPVLKFLWNLINRIILILLSPHKNKKIEKYLKKLSRTNKEEYSFALQWYDRDHPEVTIIILNWNKGRLTEQCLHEIWKYTTGVKYEIIVLDNGSSPSNIIGTKSTLPALFREIRLSSNRFFGEGNNIAVEVALGKYVLFLNNDVFVSLGWLEPLVESMKDIKVGASGPMFYYPDGTVQECGAFIDHEGKVTQRGKMLLKPLPSMKIVQSVHYISAACLLVRKSVFESLNGFSLEFEPAYYEDTDLCFRMRRIGYEIRYIPESKVVHIENFSHKEIGSVVRTSIDLNRERFKRKHNEILGLDTIPKNLIMSSPVVEKKNDLLKGKELVGIYTPFLLSPGGGERYILTIASILSQEKNVILITPDICSRARLRQLEKLLDLHLGKIILSTYDENKNKNFDFFISMGNSVIPDVPAIGNRSFYHCQFPFSTSQSHIKRNLNNLNGYLGYIVNSYYTRSNLQKSIKQYKLPEKKINILYPACNTYPSRSVKNMINIKILSVGRFFSEGHCKNYHLLVPAFRKLFYKLGSPDWLELHLAGAVYPEPSGVSYFGRIKDLSNGIPVFLHPNVDQEKLKSLYSSSIIYWHGAGLGINPDLFPEKMEHFGISIIEAMSNGCIPIAYEIGGPSEIINDKINGILYSSETDLIQKTFDLIMDYQMRERISKSAYQRAGDFSIDMFKENVFKLVSSELPLI